MCFEIRLGVEVIVEVLRRFVRHVCALSTVVPMETIVSTESRRAFPRVVAQVPFADQVGAVSIQTLFNEHKQ